MQISQSSSNNWSALVDQCVRRIRLAANNNKWLEDLGDTRQLARRVAQIALDNGRRGRVPQGIPADPVTGMPDSYIDRILHFIKIEEPTICALRDRDNAPWAEVIMLLRTRVFGYLIRRGVEAVYARELAQDLAQSSATILWEQALEQYPYDTYFGAWVSRIAAYEVSRWQRSTKEQREMRALSLDGAPDPANQQALYELLPDQTAHRFVDKIDALLTLQAGLAQIPSDCQRETIIRSLKGQTDTEIAYALRRSKQAIYSLRQRALQSLRMSLTC
jgi:DNA-directed RNA polymerase specialized sigma24 family protein